LIALEDIAFGSNLDRHCERKPKQSTVFQVKANLKGVLALIIALSVTMNFRMTTTMMSLCGLPLALSLSRR
jgi:hypothetical protein